MSARPAAIHVMSLNVCGLPSPLAPLADRAAEFCRRIDESDIDVVNLQEVWFRRTLDVIRPRLRSFPFVARRRGLAGQPAGGLVTFSRRPLGVVSYASFRGVMPGRGGFRFRAKRAINSMLQGVLSVELKELGVVVANTHLTANKDGDWSGANRYHAFQRAQVSRLHAALRRARTADTELMIVTGDLNIASDAELYPLIVDGGAWRDPFRATEPATFHLEFLPPGSSAHRIDYVLVSGDAERFPVIDTGVLFAEPHVAPGGIPMYLSDHVALTVRVGLAAQPGPI